MQDYEIWNGNTHRVDAVLFAGSLIPKIVVAKWVANLLMSRFGQDPIAFIPHSVETKIFHAPPRTKQKSPTVGFIYSPKRNKGTDITIRAIDLAKRQIPNLKVISFGGASLFHRQICPSPTEPNTSTAVPDRELPPFHVCCPTPGSSPPASKASVSNSSKPWPR